MFQECQSNSWEAEILEQLDSYAQEYNFPIFNNIYFDYADARLTVFRSSSEWLLIFEEILFSLQQRSFINSVSAYGNKIENPGSQEAITIISDAPGYPMWDENGNFLLNQWNFEILLNEEHKRFSLSARDYEAANIEPTPGISIPSQFLRLLINIDQNICFMQNDRLLEICGRSNAGLEIFLQLNDWFHPDIADDEIPSENLCFQRLASSIAEGDQGLYSCPKDKLNTHWSNWQLKLD